MEVHRRVQRSHRADHFHRLRLQEEDLPLDEEEVRCRYLILGIVLITYLRHHLFTSRLVCTVYLFNTFHRSNELCKISTILAWLVILVYQFSGEYIYSLKISFVNMDNAK